MPNPSSLALALVLAAHGICQASRPLPAPPRVVLHFEDARFRVETATAVEEVWNFAASFLDLSAVRGCAIHVHNDTVSCQKVAGDDAGPELSTRPGLVRGKQGHVLFWRSGWCRDARWRIGAVTMELALLHGTSLRREQWPAWFLDGLGAWAEGPTVGDDGWIEPRSHVERSRDALSTVRSLGTTLPSLDDVLLEHIDGLRPEQARAVRRLAFCFLLHRHGDATRTALRTALQQESGEAVGEALRHSLEEALGKEAWGSIDSGFRAYLASLPDELDLEWYPARDAVGAPSDQDFVPASPSITWLDRNRRSKFTVHATAFLTQVGQGDLAFERRDGHWIRVTLLAHADRGHVIVSERRMDGIDPDGWTVLARSSTDVQGIRLGRAIGLSMVAEPARLTVSIDDWKVLEAGWEGASLRGRFGVGGPFANQVRWKSVGVR